MTAWARAGRTSASPSRLARSAPPLRGFGLDRLSPARRGLAERSRFEMSEGAPFVTDLPGGKRVLRDRDRPFVRTPDDAILPECPAMECSIAGARHSARCPTIFTSRWSRGLASAGRQSTISWPGPSRTIGPSAFRLRGPRWTCSRRGSATSLMNCSGPADNLNGVLL
jgi:hypothetical protein